MPSVDEAIAIALSDDLIFSWSKFCEQRAPSEFVRHFAWDMRRLDAFEHFVCLMQAWGDPDQIDELWANADRERCETDAMIAIDLAKIHFRDGLDVLFRPDDGEDVRNELESLTDRFDAMHLASVREVAGYFKDDTGMLGYESRDLVADLEKAKFARDVRKGIIPSPTPIARPATGAIPLLDAQKAVASLGQPIVDTFLAVSAEWMQEPKTAFPQLPESVREHPLFEALNTAIARIVAMADYSPKQFRQTSVLPALAVLHAVHPDIYERVYNRATAAGAIISSASFDAAVKNFENRVRREVNTGAGFLTDAKGNPDPNNSDNIAVFIRQRQIELRYNEWDQRFEHADAGRDNWQTLTDDIRNDLLVDAENSQFAFRPTESRFRRGLAKIARETKFDPVLEMIGRLADTWDGVARLDSWLHHAVGVPDDDYHRAVSRNVIGGMVRRARHPGCQHQEVLLLISPKQGEGKSTLAQILAVNEEWFTDDIDLNATPQNMIPQMAGKWVIEFPELSGMARKETESLKAFLTRQTENVTKKYQADASRISRRCIFVGTTNSERPLRDETGNRRWLPVRVAREIDLAWMRANVEQIIGEAAVREANGEAFSIPRECWQVAAEHQAAAAEQPEYVTILSDWLTPYPDAFATSSTMSEIVRRAAGRQINANAYGRHLRSMGFLDTYKWTDGRSTRQWRRGSGARELIPAVDGRGVACRIIPTAFAPPMKLPPLPYQ
ncbi:MAG: hypothetical protein J0H71_18030 [Rhizobiales bacterium]|nr:hypothetical protein [Hyphomicrobiales bacterium]